MTLEELVIVGKVFQLTDLWYFTGYTNEICYANAVKYKVTGMNSEE